MKINNIPAYANEYPYIVCTVFDDEPWFYGAYKAYDKALAIALDIEGIVVEGV